MSSAYAPENQRAGNDDEVGGEEPEPLFGLHDAAVASGEADGEPVAESACECCAAGKEG
jgi:hypothetical protein